MSTIKSSGENLKLSSDNTKDIELQHNGSTKLTVKSDGKVGVGTTSPSAPLHIHAGSENVGLNIESTDPYCGIYLSDDTTTNSSFIGVVGTNFVVQHDSLEKLRIQSGGGISFNGDTASANALDDYEEGNFTPTFYASGGTAPSSQVGTGQYTKIGDVVHITGQITWGAAGSGGTNLLISLPFKGCSDARGGIAIGLQTGITHSSNHQLYLLPEVNSHSMYVCESQPDSAGHTHLGYGNVTAGGSKYFSFGGSYHTG
jgi:hypothetical protein